MSDRDGVIEEAAEIQWGQMSCQARQFDCLLQKHVVWCMIAGWPSGFERLFCTQELLLQTYHQQTGWLALEQDNEAFSLNKWKQYVDSLLLSEMFINFQSKLQTEYTKQNMEKLICISRAVMLWSHVRIHCILVLTRQLFVQEKMGFYMLSFQFLWPQLFILNSKYYFNVFAWDFFVLKTKLVLSRSFLE